LTIIDGYTHFIPKGYVAGVEAEAKFFHNTDAKNEIFRYLGSIKERPHFVDLSARLSELDKYKIDHEITVIDTSVDPNVLQLDTSRKIGLCRLLNDEMSKVNKDSKGRIFALGGINVASTVDDGESGSAFDEMKRAVKDLGLRGFVIPSNVRGKPLDFYASFWDEVARLDATIYIHPTDPITLSSRPYEAEFDLAHTFGWPFETTLALARLVFSGIMGRHPNLRIMGHHLGGMIPYYSGRIDETYSKRNASPRRAQWTTSIGGESAIDAFKTFYYDTAIGGSVPAIRLAIEVLGIERVIFATDYPFGPDSGRIRLATYPKKILDLGLPEDQNRKIFEENALRLLGN
jgi:predicted TIM-barrel fold metal-dependent hydrolase